MFPFYDPINRGPMRDPRLVVPDMALDNSKIAHSFPYLTGDTAQRYAIIDNIIFRTIRSPCLLLLEWNEHYKLIETNLTTLDFLLFLSLIL